MTGSIVKFVNGNVTCLFNKYNLNRLYLTDFDEDNLSQEINQKLKELGLDKDNDALEKLEKRISTKPNFRAMYLILTDKCNLACKYCYVKNSAPAQTHKNIIMPEGIAEKAINLFFKLTKKEKEIHIYFYGGEPLLNKKTFKFAVEKLIRDGKAEDKKLHLILITNGTLLDKATAEFCSKNKVSVSVSLDGPEELHNKMRVYYDDDSGSFNDAFQAFYNLKEANAIANISCTIAEHNYLFLPELVRYFKNQLNCSGLGFNILNYCNNSVKEAPIDKVVNDLTRAFIQARDLGLYESRIMRRVKAFVNKEFYVRDCAGYGRQIAVAPDGKIGSCHAYVELGKYFEHTVDDPPDAFFNSKVFNEWNKRITLNMKQCADCPAIAICGGGCAYNADMTHGNIWEVDDRTCVFAKKLLEWLIWDEFNHMQNIQQKINIETEEILLREISEKDERAFREFAIELSREKPLMNIYPFVDRAHSWVMSAVDERKKYGKIHIIALNSFGKQIGFCSIGKGNALSGAEHNGEVGIALLDKYQHKGLASEMYLLCEKWMQREGLQTIFCKIHPENQKSIYFFEKQGFHNVGKDPLTTLFNAKYENYLIFKKELK